MSLSTSATEPLPAAPASAGRRRLRVAVLNEEIPYPPTSGGRIRNYNLLSRLAARHDLTYLCHRHADLEEGRAAEQWLSALGVRSVIVDRPLPGKSGLGFYARLAANLLDRRPYSVASHSSRQLRAAVARFARSQPVDLWQCDWGPYYDVLRAVPDTHGVVMAANVESLIWQRYYEHESHPLKRWYIRGQWRKFVRFERDTFRHSLCTVTVSEEDAQLARQAFAAPRLAVVDNGVDTAFFQPQGLARERDVLLFLGSLDWRPNQDALRVMLDQVFPQVRAQRPGARLWVVGRTPPAWLSEAAGRTPGLELYANVPDVRPYLARASVMAVPLRIGGGSRIKILEALAMATPVVSTAVGAEGLELEHERHLIRVEGIEPLADALVAALDQPQREQARAEQGRAAVLARYDWGPLAQRLEDIWFECLAR